MPPSFATGDMWTAYLASDLFVITTNSCLNAHGSLVMGAGMARTARDRFPGIDNRLGKLIQAKCGHLGRYYLLIDPLTHIAAFQVKQHWNDPADTALILGSTHALVRWLANDTYPRSAAERDATLDIALNFPGVGFGGLSRATVLPYITDLPANVTVWTKGD